MRNQRRSSQWTIRENFVDQSYLLYFSQYTTYMKQHVPLERFLRSTSAPRMRNVKSCGASAKKSKYFATILGLHQNPEVTTFTVEA